MTFTTFVQYEVAKEISYHVDVFDVDTFVMTRVVNSPAVIFQKLNGGGGKPILDDRGCGSDHSIGRETRNEHNYIFNFRKPRNII